MELVTLFLVTLPSLWCMPTEWSQWSTVGSQDSNDAPPGDGGDIVHDFIDGLLDDGGPLDDLIDGLDDGGPVDNGLGIPVGPTLGGAALATLAGIAATSGLIKAGILKTGMVTTGLFGAGSWFKDQDHDSGVLLQNVLLQNGRLDKGEALTSRTGAFTLLMQEDGNLVISHKDGVVEWASNTVGTGSYFLFKDDGDLVVYDGGSTNKAVWNSGTGGQGGVKMELSEEGFMALHGSSGQIIWKSRPHTLVANQVLHSGHSMASSNGDFKLNMQGDGDLVLYDISGDQGVVTWRTGPSNHKFHAYVKLQSDGNLVLRDEVHLLQWESETKGSGASSLVLQDYGKLELCCNKDGSAIWTSAPDNQGISGMKAHEIKDHGVNSGIEIKAPVTPLKLQNLIDSLTVERLKPFGPGFEPLGNLHLGAKFQGNENEAVKPAQQTAEIINSGQMKSGVLRQSRERLDRKWNSWTVWRDFTACSATCGPATRTRERTCNDPFTAEITCQGPAAEIFSCRLPSCPDGDIQDCNHDDCPVINGGWSVWSDFGRCSATCGSATKRRERICTSSESSDESLICQGSKEDVVDCGLADCPIDGGWSAWSEFSTCTATCGGATKRRERTCASSESSDVSLTCQGSKEDVVDCGLADCPIP